MRGITKKQFAAQQGVSAARVSQWLKSKIISALPDRSIDPIEAERDLLRNRDPSKRFDWEYRTQLSRQNHSPINGLDELPPPFTGNIVRDFGLMALVAFYPYFVEKIIPLQMVLLRELHLADKSAKGACVCFDFMVNKIINSFVREDAFKKFFRVQFGEDIDQFASEVFKGGRQRKISLPHDLDLGHPPIVLSFLKELGPDWPSEPTKKRKSMRNEDHKKKGGGPSS